MKDDEKWWKMMKNDERWWKMMKYDETWWKMIKNDERCKHGWHAVHSSVASCCWTCWAPEFDRQNPRTWLFFLIGALQASLHVRCKDKYCFHRLSKKTIRICHHISHDSDALMPLAFLSLAAHPSKSSGAETNQPTPHTPPRHRCNPWKCLAPRFEVLEEFLFDPTLQAMIRYPPIHSAECHSETARFSCWGSYFLV